MQNKSVMCYNNTCKKLSLHCIFIVSFLFISMTVMIPGVSADIYKYVDEEGVLHLTNVPSIPNAKYILILKEKRVHFHSDIDVNKYDHIIAKAASKYKIDQALIKAVIKAESNFNHRAVSPVGAQGLMQLMPSTAYALQVDDVFQPENNIEGGVRYLRYLLNVYKGDLRLALAAYNAGETAVAKYNTNIPPFRETQNYIRRVLSYYDDFKK
ncbi:MAG TPA: transglycosylase SLT domain-containing protein [Smithellaceae bacterium]|nr:transglycosylase SLT domain-containing protein [Smithellaceae bacterium]HOF78252.1 transglycosylase SLT domain-containing protein [Smithellaceae bacterium]HPW23509.1 transglycosylase SLT domain-containing protein [Smithellaceae bacterium]HQG96178.1 transglycosylase SLT domain-containing protein [Smithellaceae bacterium]HQK27741.1 transglycosylase SLT domain-containing protein [Smithellaceae bacterium]